MFSRWHINVRHFQVVYYNSSSDTKHRFNSAILATNLISNIHRQFLKILSTLKSQKFRQFYKVQNNNQSPTNKKGYFRNDCQTQMHAYTNAQA